MSEKPSDWDDLGPFVAIGNEDLGPELHAGDQVHCPHCNGAHEVQPAKNTETGKSTESLLWVRCGDEMYVVGVGGKFWPGGGFSVGRRGA